MTTALRKHMLRADMRVYVANETQANNPNDLISSIKSLLSAAIVKGLDIIGIVSQLGPDLGWRARQVALSSGIDIWVVPGQEYVCLENEKIIAYLIEEPLAPGLTIEQAIAKVHESKGFVMAVNVTKRQAQLYNKMNQTNNSGPDAIELFNELSGGYMDVETNLMGFVSSGSQTANELEQSTAYTLVNRKEFESLGLMPEGQGAEYVPQYLQNIESQPTAPQVN